MPVGPEHPGRTAGATFELFYQPDCLLPHRRAAWLIGAELLTDAAATAEIEGRRDRRFEPVASAFTCPSPSAGCHLSGLCLSFTQSRRPFPAKDALNIEAYAQLCISARIGNALFSACIYGRLSSPLTVLIVDALVTRTALLSRRRRR
jgi:hypothetical protein